MDAAWAIGAVAALAAGLAGIAVATRRRPVGQGAIVLGADALPRGTVTIDGDVVIRGGARAMGARAEMDVPTQAVDQILSALQGAGFDIRETGLTVDTDEGEETLTTVAMDLASMPSNGAPQHPDDRLVITGDLLIEKGVRTALSADVQGDLTIQDRAMVTGKLTVAGHIVVGTGCRLVGDVRGGKDVHLGLGTRARVVTAAADLHLADAARDPGSRYDARRIHVAEA